MMNQSRHGNIAFFIPHLGCRHQCSFCDQKSISGKTAMPNSDELRTIIKQALENHPHRTFQVAFFGGSFTAVDNKTQRELLGAASDFIGRGITGIRISTRPDAIDTGHLKMLKSFGVEAVELGAQSMDDEVLLKNSRGHTAADTQKAVSLIRKEGFEMGLQMMPGLYGADKEKDILSASEMINCKPDTIRIYPTLVIQGTRLAEWWREGKYSPLTLEEGVRLTAQIMELFLKSNIRIIRVGLHSETSLKENLLAGPYHPAFRQLCDGMIMQNRLTVKLKEWPKGQLEVAVHPKNYSDMMGHKKSNLEYFLKRDYDITVTTDSKLLPYQLKISC